MHNKMAVILDWAGTTVDFGCFAPVQAFLEAFHVEGIDPTLEEVRKPMGMLKKDHVRTMMEMNRIRQLWKEVHGADWTEEDVQRVYEKSEKGIIDIVHNFAEPKPYVLEAIEQLRSQGIKIGSTTGYTREMMEIVVHKAKEYGYEPDVWFCPDDVGNMGRPYPYMIYRNMEQLKMDSVEQVVKVGDTVADIREGKHANVISIGVVEGSSLMGLSEEEFNALSKEEYQSRYQQVEQAYQEAGADFVIAHLGKLQGLLQELGR